MTFSSKFSRVAVYNKLNILSMKKFRILLMVAFLLVFQGLTPRDNTQAADVYYHAIVLSPGWNAVSTPRLVDSHQFSVAETTANFDVYVLNPGSISGWSSMADINQTEFTPLYGYFINNKTSFNQTLTLNYKQNVEPNQRLFSRTLSAGWNIVGVANPSYALKQADPSSYDTNNVTNILTPLVNLTTSASCVSTVLDFTADQSDKSSVAAGGAWSQKVWASANQVNDLRETKAYAIYTTSACTYQGSQNNDPITTYGASAIGTLAISKCSDSPTGNVVASASGTTLVKFCLTAANEDIRISSLPILSTIATGSDIDNAKVYFDGAQVGSTADLTDAAAVTFNFGMSVVVPAGQTKVLEVKGDIKNASGVNHVNGDIILITLNAGSSNASALSSTTTISTGSVAGNNLTVVVSALSLSKNSSVVDASASTPTGMLGQQNVRIGSFVATAGSAEAVTITQITMTDDVGATTGSSLADTFFNLRLQSAGPADANGNYAAGAAIGQTIGTLTDIAGTTYNFTPSPALKLNKSQQIVIDVYADVLSSASTTQLNTVNNDTNGIIYPSTVTATGNDTSSSVNGTMNVGLQNVYIAPGGTLTVENVPSSTQVKSNIVYENQADVELYKFKMTALTEAIDITRFIISDTIAAGTLGATVANGTPTSTIFNFKLYDGATLIAGPRSLTITATPTLGGYIDFNLGSSSPYRVNSGVEKVLTLKGTISSWPSISSGSTHTFSLNTNPLEDGSTRAVTARGVGSSTTLNGPTTGVSGNTIAVRRAYPVVERLALTSTTLAGGSTSQKQVANFKVTAVGGQVRLKKLTFDVSLTDTTTSTAMALSNFKLYRNGSLMGSTEYSIFDGTGTAAADALSPGGSATLSTVTLAGGASNGNAANSTSTRVVVLMGTQITDELGTAGTGGSEEVIASGSSNTYEIKADVANAHSGASTDTDSITVQLLGDNAQTAHLTGDLISPSGSVTSVMYRYGVVSLDASTNYNFIWSDYSASANEHKATYFPAGTGKDWTHGYQVPSSTGQSSYIPLDSWVVSK